MVSLFKFLVSCVFIAFPLLVVFNVFVVLSLKSKFPNLWQAQGQPEHWIYMTRTTKANHFFTFLNNRDFLKTNDKSFVLQCKVLIFSWYTFMCLFLVTLVIGAISLS